ncbi:hypothetical protein COCCU_12465 [Corynebacterium occultum]|uniref:Uncharacterized protein n=1 Tax=Corynebacterium occultum TaxID=2675219 RepID=A0A6B8VW73_9CORY|nr:hypothetical protein [Corynebacterium occultum]QGU08393.1 hypothetical protein COCCU_12465 [Corynebacterium occultum]
MELFALALAGVAGIAGVTLWFVDASRRRGSTPHREPLAAGTPEQPPATPASAQPDTPEPEPGEATEPGTSTEPLDVEVEDTEDTTPLPEPVTTAASVAEPEPEPEPEPTPEPAAEPAVEPEPELFAESGETESEPESEPEAEAAVDIDKQDQDKPETRRAPRRTGLSLPGSQRRERRAWAEANEWEFKRTDAYLDDEWNRGAAASGAVVRDVVSGVVYGKEMHLVDLGGVTVMAVRRGAPSDVVIDLRRIEAIPADRSAESPDLVPVSEINGFRLYATETGPAERFIDERVTAALDALPEIVAAVWAEGDWVLAQTLKGSHQGDWDEMCAPLASLADAARTLPPPLNTPQAINHEDLDPTRRMPPKQHPPAQLVAVPDPEPDTPLVIRPEEPLELPSRTRSESRGVVEPRPVGVDEVAPIAEETPELDPEKLNGLRVLRDLSRGSSIFDDLTKELGTDPLSTDPLGGDEPGEGKN